MIEGTDMEGMDAEAILMKAHQTNNQPLFNNAAQVNAGTAVHPLSTR
jgi:hypothetical protein